MSGSTERAVTRLAQQLIRYSTVNPPGNEEEAMRCLGRYLADYGITVEYQAISSMRCNLIARIPGTETSGHLVFSGHMDVVHPGTAPWSVDPFAADLRDGRIVARGAADMKGGVAAMAVAMCELVESGFKPRADLILGISAGEEVDTCGARFMASSGVFVGATDIVVGEPTGLDVFIAEKGVFWIRVTARGKTAHGSMPHLGVNPIMFLTALIETLTTHDFSYQKSPMLGGPSISVNTFSGGVKTNVVADHAEMTVDMRLVPGQKAEEMRAEIDAMIDAVRRDTGLTVETQVDVLQSMPAVETAADDELVTAVVDAVAAVRHHAPELGGVSYGTDGAVLAPDLDASMVIVGPGGTDQLHQVNEYVEVGELVEAVEVYKAIAHRMLDP